MYMKFDKFSNIHKKTLPEDPVLHPYVKTKSAEIDLHFEFTFMKYPDLSGKVTLLMLINC